MADHRGNVLLGATPLSERRSTAGHDPDEVRIAELVHLHFDFIWRLLRRFGSTEAEDGSQQVFTIAWKKLADVQPGKERAFLAGIATKVASEQRRARSRRLEVLDLPSETADSGLDPSELFDRQQARKLFDLVLEALPADLKEAFVLFEVEEFTMREIAEALEVPQGTVASRLRRAREAFQVELERRWPKAAKAEP